MLCCAVRSAAPTEVLLCCAVPCAQLYILKSCCAVPCTQLYLLRSCCAVPCTQLYLPRSCCAVPCAQLYLPRSCCAMLCAQLCSLISIHCLLFTVDGCRYNSEILTLHDLHHCNPRAAFATDCACVYVRTHCESLLQRLLLK